MMVGCFKNLMTGIHPDEIEMKGPWTNSLVAGWVTYLDLTHKIKCEVVVVPDVPSDLLGHGG